jgi:hypothetical protein
VCDTSPADEAEDADQWGAHGAGRSNAGVPEAYEMTVGRAAHEDEAVAVAEDRPTIAPPDDFSDDSDDEDFAELLAALMEAQDLWAPDVAGRHEAPAEIGQQLTLDEAGICHREVRDYYKGQIKSANKLYDESKFPGETPPKVRLRNHNANVSHKSILGERRSDGASGSMSGVQLGENLVARDIRSGNCREMTAVAAYMVNRRFPTAPMHMVSVNQPGDHAFLIVGELPDRGPIAGWSDHPASSASHVIDVWMNICCHTRDYPGQVIRKLNKWAAEGKTIAINTPFDKEPNLQYETDEPGRMHSYYGIAANSPEYTENLLTSRCSVYVTR